MKTGNIYNPSEWKGGEELNIQLKARSTVAGFVFVFQKKKKNLMERKTLNALVRSLEHERI